MSSPAMPLGYLGNILHTRLSPKGKVELEEYQQGGIVVDDSGSIIDIADATTLRQRYPETHWTDFGDQLVIPGLIDGHIHFPQLDMIGAYGEELLGWLTKYTYPHEMKFADHEHAEKAALRFCKELLSNGTTLAACYSSSHETSTNQLFQAMAKAGLRGIVGKVSMNRHAPQGLLNDNDVDLQQCENLISTWHGYEDRLFYAITPRFAPSCTMELMRDLGKLHREHPSTYIQTHYAETKDEIAWVSSLFPNCADYLQVYENAELINSKTLLGHGIHMSLSEIHRIAEHGTKIVHCPTSNMFLGSGLIPLNDLNQSNVATLLGSDVGAGTSFSMFSTMRAAYKAQKLRGTTISAADLLHMATLGAASSLGMSDQLGNFQKGKAADFVVLDWQRHRLLRERFASSQSKEEKLFATIFMGDDRLVNQVFINGTKVHEQ